MIVKKSLNTKHDKKTNSKQNQDFCDFIVLEIMARDQSWQFLDFHTYLFEYMTALKVHYFEKTLKIQKPTGQMTNL